LIIPIFGDIINIGNQGVVMKHVELLLHPVRMRVVLALAYRVLTTQQLADSMPDVPQTTLYRHINVLLEGGILQVVRENKVRGTVERALTLVEGAARIDMETSADLSPEQQEQLFMTFMGRLLADFRQAQSQPLAGVPPAFYTRQRLYLTLEQLRQLSQHIDALLGAYKAAPTEPRDAEVQQWLFTGIIMPDTNKSQPEEEIVV
jgi:DNA-binding transcriptional ArsR family regulator